MHQIFPEKVDLEFMLDERKFHFGVVVWNQQLFFFILLKHFLHVFLYLLFFLFVEFLRLSEPASKVALFFFLFLLELFLYFFLFDFIFNPFGKHLVVETHENIFITPSLFARENIELFASLSLDQFFIYGHELLLKVLLSRIGQNQPLFLFSVHLSFSVQNCKLPPFFDGLFFLRNIFLLLNGF